MGDKLAGVGLQNIFVLWILLMLMTVAAKVIVTKYPIKGLSEIVQAV
jgi:hypothetical protein